MLNEVQLMGRLTSTPELKMVNGATPVVNFSLAVPRAKKNEDGTRAADFVDCAAWRGTAEFIAKYFSKGQPAVIVGSIRTKKWLDMENETRYRTEVLVEKIFFAGQKPNTQPIPATQYTPPEIYAPPLEELADSDELPF